MTFVFVISYFSCPQLFKSDKPATAHMSVLAFQTQYVYEPLLIIDFMKKFKYEDELVGPLGE